MSIGRKVSPPRQKTFESVHLSLPVDPLVEDPLVPVHHGAPEVVHPLVLAAVRPLEVPVEELSLLRLEEQVQFGKYGEAASLDV